MNEKINNYLTIAEENIRKAQEGFTKLKRSNDIVCSTLDSRFTNIRQSEDELRRMIKTEMSELIQIVGGFIYKIKGGEFKMSFSDEMLSIYKNYRPTESLYVMYRGRSTNSLDGYAWGCQEIFLKTLLDLLEYELKERPESVKELDNFKLVSQEIAERFEIISKKITS